MDFDDQTVFDPNPMAGKQEATVDFQPVDLAKLVFVEGYRKNESIPILKERFTIGREPGNDVVIMDDNSVSRHHASIEVQNREYILITSESRNGVLHNGKLYQGEPVKLSHGDRIQVGRTVIRFEMMEKVLGAQAAQASSGSGALKGIFLAVVGVLVVGGLAWWGITTFGSQPTQPTPRTEPRKQATRPITPARSTVAQQQRKRLQGLLNKGMTLYKERKWREALFAFQQASALDPKHPAAQQLASDARAELRSASTLAAVKNILAMDHVRRCKRYQMAWEKLSSMDSQQAPGSVYSEKLWQQQFQVQQGMKRYCRRRRNQPSLAPARPALAKLINKRKKTGAMLFNGGLLRKAREYFEKRKQQSKLQQLDGFISAYNRGRIAYKSRDAIAGIPEFKKTLRLDRKLGGGQSVYTRQVKQMLANLYYFDALNAIEYKKNHAAAIRKCSTALRYDTSHQGCQQQLKDLRRLAESWYKLALMHMKAERHAEARRLLRKSIQLLPPQSQLYQTIRRKLLNIKK